MIQYPREKKREARKQDLSRRSVGCWDGVNDGVEFGRESEYWRLSAAPDRGLEGHDMKDHVDLHKFPTHIRLL